MISADPKPCPPVYSQTSQQPVSDPSATPLASVFNRQDPTTHTSNTLASSSLFEDDDDSSLESQKMIAQHIEWLDYQQRQAFHPLTMEESFQKHFQLHLKNPDVLMKQQHPISFSPDATSSVTPMALPGSMGTSMKANVESETTQVYFCHVLMFRLHSIIYDYLKKRGFHYSASVLQKEARLAQGIPRYQDNPLVEWWKERSGPSVQTSTHQPPPPPDPVVNPCIPIVPPPSIPHSLSLKSYSSDQQRAKLLRTLNVFGLCEQDLPNLTPVQQVHILTHMRQVDAQERAQMMRHQAVSLEQQRSLQDTEKQVVQNRCNSSTSVEQNRPIKRSREETPTSLPKRQRAEPSCPVPLESSPVHPAVTSRNQDHHELVPKDDQTKALAAFAAAKGLDLHQLTPQQQAQLRAQQVILIQQQRLTASRQKESMDPLSSKARQMVLSGLVPPNMTPHQAEQARQHLMKQHLHIHHNKASPHSMFQMNSRELNQLEQEFKSHATASTSASSSSSLDWMLAWDTTTTPHHHSSSACEGGLFGDPSVLNS